MELNLANGGKAVSVSDAVFDRPFNETLVHQIVKEQVSVAECIDFIVAAIDQRSRVRFTELVDVRDREAMVATFVGLLELLKSQRIRVQQSRPFDDRWVEKKEPQEISQVLEEKGESAGSIGEDVEMSDDVEGEEEGRWVEGGESVKE